jgi:hypothetical protein
MLAVLVRFVNIVTNLEKTLFKPIWHFVSNTPGDFTANMFGAKRCPRDQ